MMQVFHGDIVTCDQGGSVYKYLVEDKGRIVYVGDQLTRIYKHNSTMIDLGSRALLPAFGDGHIHFSSWSMFNSTYDVREAASFDEIGAIIREFAAADPKIPVLFGFGHSMHTVEEQRLITRTELDRYVKERPVYLVCYDGHSAVANTAALGLMPSHVRSARGFDLETGQILFDAFYKATDHISGKLPLRSLLSYILKGMDTLAGYGVGLVHTVEGLGYPRDMDVDMVRFLARGSQLNFRTYFQTMDLRKVQKRRLPRVGGCFECALDGCFGTRDAALLEPYSDDPGNRGILYHSNEEVANFVREAARRDLQVQLHCIGDAAVVQAVEAIEAALKEFPSQNHRHTLIHACLIPEETLEKIAALKIGITLQPGFLISPLEPAAYIEKLLGDRAGEVAPLKKMLDMGINVSGGSDAPVAGPDPLEGIYGACNHRDPAQSVSIAEALRMYTHNVARTSFDDLERGTLEEGKAADLVVLSENPLKVSPGDITRLEVEKTYLAGEEYTGGRSISRAALDSIRNLKKPV